MNEAFPFDSMICHGIHSFPHWMLGEHLYQSACIMFLMSLLLLSGWITVVSSYIFMGVDPVISRNAYRTYDLVTKHINCPNIYIYIYT